MINCQVCGTTNPIHAEYCGKCGARLMVITGTERWHDSPQLPLSLEDHFLERISNLEDTVSTILEHLAKFAETIESIERVGLINKAGLSALVDVLNQSQTIKYDILKTEWEKAIDAQFDDMALREKFNQMRPRFLALFHGQKEKKTAFQTSLQEAEMMLFSGQLLSFAQTLKKALKMDPANYELSFFLGEFFHDYNQEECIEYLEQTLRYQPNHYDAHLMLAISYHTEDKLKPAYKHFESARKLNPRARTPLVGLGSLMLTRRKHEQALELLQEANAIREDAYTHYLIGVAFSELGRQGKAITHLEKAIQMDPDREEFHYRLGIVCLERGWTRRAKKALAMANELNPNKIEYQEALNWANEKRVQTEDVLDLNDWQQALEALNLMSKKRLKQALPVLRQLSDKYNRNSIVALGLAALYTALQRWRPAQELIGTIKSSAGSDLTRSLAYLLQVETLRKQERHEEALEVLKELESAITSFYATTIVNYNRALCLADLSRDLDEAERLAKTALERTPPEFRAKVLDALGWVYYKKGHMEEALKTLEESLSLKETKSTLTHMSLTMIALDLNEQATKIFQRLIQYAKMDPLIDPFTMKYLLDRVQDQINAFDPPSP